MALMRILFSDFFAEVECQFYSEDVITVRFCFCYAIASNVSIFLSRGCLNDDLINVFVQSSCLVYSEFDQLLT